jgi:UDP-N-acetylglucosamine:LPS N-acetylglucosamine transferase
VAVAQSEADPAALAQAMDRLLGDEGARRAMAGASRAQGMPNAARDVASDLLRMSEGGA